MMLKEFLIKSKGHQYNVFSKNSFFTIDNTAPTVTLTDTDSDNLVSGSSVVTITATFSEAMASAPTINITGEVSNVAMTASSTADVWIYPWTVSTTTSGIVSATVAGTDVSGKPTREPLVSLLPLIIQPLR